MVNNENSKITIAKQFFIILGIQLIMFVFLTTLISCIGLILKVSINSITVLVSLALTSIFGLVITFFTIDKKNFTWFCTTQILSFFIISFICISTCGSFFDITVDSVLYHKVSVGKLAEGWNPVYEDVKDFETSYKLYYQISDDLYELSINHYAKGLEIFAASMYKFTNNIETGKSFNLFFLIGSLLIYFGALLKRSRKLLCLVSFGIVFSTVVFSQLLTFYIDGAVYLLLSLLLFLLVIFHTKDNPFTRLEQALLYFMVMILLINTKFTAFGYAGIYSLGFYLYDIILCFRKKMKWHSIIKFTIFVVITLLFGVLIVGSNTYVKNFITKGNPFYPTMGKGKIDVIEGNVPVSYQNKNNIQRIFTSLYSKSEADYTVPIDYKIKIPFYTDAQEIYWNCKPDLRIGGMGVFFSGLLTVSLIIIIIYSFFLFKDDKNLFVMFSIIMLVTILLAIFMDISWWARLFPMPQYFVIIALYLLIRYQNKVSIISVFIILLLLFIESRIILRGMFEDRVAQSYFDNTAVSILPEDSRCHLKVFLGFQKGIIYNLHDAFLDRVDSIEDLPQDEFSSLSEEIFTDKFNLFYLVCG